MCKIAGHSIRPISTAITALLMLSICRVLRHSLAIWLLDAGVPIEAIADLLGLSSVAVTAIYAKVVDHRKYTPSEILAKKLDKDLVTQERENLS